MDLISSLSLIRAARKKGSKRDEDFVDRLNRTYTVGVLVLFSVVVSTSTYVGERINCWCPAHFTDNYIDYTNKICWVSNTYYIPIEEKIPDDDLGKPHLKYYQWTPFIMLFSAFLFYFPSLIWRSMNDSSGLNVADMVGAAEVFNICSKYENREKVVRFIVKHMDRYLELRRRAKRLIFGDALSARIRRCCSRGTSVGRKYGNFLVALYLFTKVLYVLNAVSQLFILNYSLGLDFHMYGAIVIQRLMNGEDMMVSDQFPRTTLCDFEVREIGRVHKYTVQCVLPINLFNEKIFIFLWFWIVFLIIVNCGSFLQWLLRCLFARDRLRYVKNRINTISKIQSVEKYELLKEFTHDYLMEDGLFALRMVSKNSSDIVCAEILNELWIHFKKTKVERDEERRLLHKTETNDND